MLEILNQALELVNRGGVVALLLVAVWALVTERVVPRGRYLDVQRRLDRATGLTDRVLDTTEQVVRGKSD